MNGTNADPDQAPYHAVPVLFPGGPKGALASTGVGQMPPAIIGGGGTLEGSAGHDLDCDMETHRYLDVPEGPGSFPALIIIRELYGIFTRLNNGTSTEVGSCAQSRGSTRGNDSRPAEIEPCASGAPGFSSAAHAFRVGDACERHAFRVDDACERHASTRRRDELQRRRHPSERGPLCEW